MSVLVATLIGYATGTVTMYLIMRHNIRQAIEQAKRHIRELSEHEQG